MAFNRLLEPVDEEDLSPGEKIQYKNLHDAFEKDLHMYAGFLAKHGSAPTTAQAGDGGNIFLDMNDLFKKSVI